MCQSKSIFEFSSHSRQTRTRTMFLPLPLSSSLLLDDIFSTCASLVIAKTLTTSLVTVLAFRQNSKKSIHNDPLVAIRAWSLTAAKSTSAKLILTRPVACKAPCIVTIDPSRLQQPWIIDLQSLQTASKAGIRWRGQGIIFANCGREYKKLRTWGMKRSSSVFEKCPRMPTTANIIPAK